MQPLGLEEFRRRFNEAFAAELTQCTRAAYRIDPLYGELWQNLSEYLTRGGKRLRPYLTYLAYHGCGGRDVVAVTRHAIAQELYHNAWLMHDDLIDRDLKRHGGPNIAGLYRAEFAQRRLHGGRHLADAMALLAGDIAVNTAGSLMLESDFPPERRLNAATIQHLQNQQILAGETLDVLMPTLNPEAVSIERLLKIYVLKTAAYSFVAPLQAGAALAGTEPGRLPTIAAFAQPLGVAFQLADDLLGMFGNEQELGKSVLSDLREGKRTVLLIMARQLATPTQVRRLDTLMGNPKAGYRHLAEVRRILESCGARAKTDDLARRHVDEALAALPAIGFSHEVEAHLRQLSEFTIQRRF